jgi:prefoldin subunit 5
MTPDELQNVKEELHQMDKRLALLEQKVDQIDHNIQKIADALGWIAKITGAGVITAFVTFIVKGGLTGG